jgi:hypothetical protein
VWTMTSEFQERGIWQYIGKSGGSFWRRPVLMKGLSSQRWWWRLRYANGRSRLSP